MAFGDITVTLRPIKFAFLVNPAERDILDRVVAANLFQWGGLRNPIVPIYGRLRGTGSIYRHDGCRRPIFAEAIRAHPSTRPGLYGV
jgi:hypothetical protein